MLINGIVSTMASSKARLSVKICKFSKLKILNISVSNRVIVSLDVGVLMRIFATAAFVGLSVKELHFGHVFPTNFFREQAEIIKYFMC